MKLPVLMLALLAPPVVTAEVLDSSSAGFTLQNEVIVPTDPMTSWTALVDHVGEWWPSDHTWFGDARKLGIEARAGGCFCEIDGARQVEHMRISYVDPGRLLRMLGGLGPLQGMGLHGALDWQFTAVDGGTRITLRYRASGYAPEDLKAYAGIVDQVQAQQLGGLASFLRRER